MENKPLITIITVTYNAALLLEDTILSVLSQSYKNVEYVLIDGGSTDNSISIIQKHIANITQFVSEPDKGIYDAMNKGILMAKGDIIGLLNAGDAYEPGVFEILAQNYKNDDKLCVYYGDTVFNYAQMDVNAKVKAHLQNIQHKMSLCHQSVFITRDAYKDFGIYNIGYKYSADYALILNLYLKGVKFVNLNTTVAIYLAGGVSDKSVITSRLERISAHRALNAPQAAKTIYIAFKEILYQLVFTSLRYVIGKNKNERFWKKKLSK